MTPLSGILELRLLLILLPWMLVSGWINPIRYTPVGSAMRVSAGPTSSTALFMFDWLKPKQPQKKDDGDERETSKDEKKEHVFGNFFSTMNTPHSTSTPVSEVSETVSKKPQEADEKTPRHTRENQATAVSSPATPSKGERSNGKVSWFNSQKGFGFILPDDARLTMDEKKDIFVHHSAIQDPDAGFKKLVVGERVQFEVEIDSKGRTRAIHVTGPESGPVQAAVKRAQRKAKDT